MINPRRFRPQAISRSVHFAAASFLAAAGPSARGQLCAESYGAYPIATGSVDVCLTDLDGDGWADLALPNQNSETVTLMRNAGDGTFAHHADLALSGDPHTIASVDLDGDGDLDLAVGHRHASSVSDAVSILRNLGGGNFAPAVEHFVDFQPRIVAADLDGDGDPDLAMAHVTGIVERGLSVLQNLGGGNFAAPVTRSFGISPFGFVASDFDGDGDIDLAAGEWQGNRIAVLHNLGAGTFGAPVLRSTVASPGRMKAADFDQDGDVDLIATSGTSAVVAYHANLGNGTFAAHTTISLPARVNDAVAADLDADGDPDLALTGHSTDSLFVLKNQGAAVFAPAVTIGTPFGPIAPVAADLDGDGDVDVAVAGISGGVVEGNLVAVYENHGDGSFPTQPSYPAGNDPLRVKAADLDGDGLADLVVMNQSPSGLSWMRNVGEARFGPPNPLPAGASPYHVVPADLDGDGDRDLVNSSAQLQVHVNLGQGTFAPPTSYDAGLWPRSIAIADFDGDGDADLATNNPTPGTVTLLANVGAATFQLLSTVPAGASPDAVVAGDVDGDGDSDLVTRHFFARTISVIRNLGGAAFAPPEVHSMARSPWELGLFDLDGDGDLDVAVADNLNLVVFENPGDGVFLPPVAHPVVLMRSVAGSDLDGDGDIDLAGHGASTVTLLENLGGLMFAPPLRVDVGAGARDVDCADLDGDGDGDVISANEGADSVTVVIGCVRTGSVICAGDGSGTACPCGNSSPAGAGRGCTSSLGLAGGLRASGLAYFGADTLVLQGTGMPDASALYFQGTTAVNAGAGAVFGDGLRCAGGSVVRLATKVNAGGASAYPGAGEPSVSVRGAILAPGERVYQVWYRNAASFCTPSTFNLTNGVRIAWSW